MPPPEYGFVIEWMVADMWHLNIYDHGEKIGAMRVALSAKPERRLDLIREIDQVLGQLTTRT